MNTTESYTKSILDLENIINRLEPFTNRDSKLKFTLQRLKTVQDNLIDIRNGLDNQS